ncbi:unnamed protein product [Closterium sp. Naga37s-1]|nr:unnamed protein product [Closterium sp. Naga37s-1]
MAACFAWPAQAKGRAAGEQQATGGPRRQLEGGQSRINGRGLHKPMGEQQASSKQREGQGGSRREGSSAGPINGRVEGGTHTGRLGGGLPGKESRGEAHTTPLAGGAEEAVPRRAVPPRIADLGARTVEAAEEGAVDEGAAEGGAAAGGVSEAGQEEEEEVQRLEDEAPSRVGEAAGSRTARREHLDATTSAPSHQARRGRAPQRRSRPQSRLQSPQPQQEQVDGHAIGGEHGGNAIGRCRHPGFAAAETGDEATQGAERPDEGIRADAEFPPAGTEGAETTPGIASPVRRQARALEMATGDATAGCAAPHEAATASAPAHGFASPPWPLTGAGRQWWTPPARSTLRERSRATSGVGAACSSRILSFDRGNWQELYEEAAKAIQLPAQPRHTTDEIGCLARAEGLAKRGNLKKSLQALQATPVAPTTPDTLAALQARHPPAELLIPDWVTNHATDTPPLIPLRDFRKIIAKCPNGVGAGPSGTTSEHLRDAALGNPDVCQHLHALTNTALAGQLCPEAASLLTVSRLVAFVKPGGGIRPIAVGECLHRLIAKCALYLTGAAARDFFTPLQLGVAVPGGTEAAIHIIRKYLEENPTAIALQMDIANAFNAIERAAVFEGLQSTPLAPLLPFCAAWSPGPMNDADLPTGIHFHRAGLRVLGSPVGTADGCATQLREKLATASSPLPLVGRMDPQLSYLLLTRCISRRASFLARTTPLALLPTAEWSAWGERLLHTLLAAAQISEPRAPAEKERIWNQASLPTTIGGLGLTDPSTEGSYAYLASAVATAHLLRSLGSKLHQEVAELAPLLDADPTNPAALPQRLAVAEASLPPSTAAVMKAHALNLKTHTAMEADAAGIADAIEPLAEGYLFQLLEPPLGPFVDQAGGE